MSKTKIILASTLSVLAVASVTTAAVVVTQKRKKQSDSPKTGNEGNQVVVADDSKFEYTLDAEQTKELTAKLLLVKGQDVTVTLTENNASKTIKTKVKEDGKVDFPNLKDGKTYTITKIIVKEGENERDLIAEVKAHNEDSGQGKGPEVGGSESGNPQAGDTQPGGAQAGNPQAGGAESSSPQAGGAESGSTQPGGTQAGKPQTGGSESGNPQAGDTQPGGAQAGGAESGNPQAGGAESGSTQPGEAQAGKPQTGEKEAEIKKITIVQQQYDKSSGYINFWFKTTKENFEKMRTKSWNMEFQLGNNYQNELTPAAKVGASGDENVALIRETGNEVIIFMATNYYYNKATNAPQTTYKLVNLYYDNDKSNNVLSESSKDIQVKYE